MTMQHYSTGLTRENIDRALRAAGKDPDHLRDEDLAPLEDFHSLGRLATLGLLDLAAVGPEDHVLDAGTGIGGTARLLAATVGCRVTAVDLSEEYCEAARWLNAGTGLGGAIDVRQADITDLPFADDSFDVLISQHVQMNVADKDRLYAEAHRVLRPGGRLALWDVTAGPEQPILLPVPWASAAGESHLVTPARLREILESTGFEVTVWNDLTAPAIEAMTGFVAATPAPLGLHVFVPDFATRAANLVENGRSGRTRLIQAVLRTSP